MGVSDPRWDGRVFSVGIAIAVMQLPVVGATEAWPPKN
jgi:hypothetical protein